jgi:hypothetical protein
MEGCNRSIIKVQMVVFRVVTPWKLVARFFFLLRDMLNPFSGMKCYSEYLKLVAACSSETSVPAYKATRCHNPEDHSLKCDLHENLNTVKCYLKGKVVPVLN